MRKALTVLFFTVSVVIFAAVEDVVPVDVWLRESLAWVLTVPGMSALAIAGGAAQVAMRFFQTPLASFTGKGRLVAVCLFNLIAVVIAGVMSGGNIVSVLLSAAGLAAIQVFLHQLYKQFVEKKD